jgi:hypothetical protein
VKRFVVSVKQRRFSLNIIRTSLRKMVFIESVRSVERLKEKKEEKRL